LSSLGYWLNSFIRYFSITENYLAIFYRDVKFGNILCKSDKTTAKVS